MKITGYISQPEKNLYMQSVTPFESKKDDFGESAILGVITQLERQTLLGFGGAFTEAAFGREISYFFNAIKIDTDISDIHYTLFDIVKISGSPCGINPSRFPSVTVVPNAFCRVKTVSAVNVPFVTANSVS